MNALPLLGIFVGLPAAVIDPPPFPTYDCFGLRTSGIFEPPVPPPRWQGATPDGIPDAQQCVGNWHRDSWTTPSDVAIYVSEWFYDAANPTQPNTTDLDCDGAITPADVSLFVGYWYLGTVTGATCP